MQTLIISPLKPKILAIVQNGFQKFRSHGFKIKILKFSRILSCFQEHNINYINYIPLGNFKKNNKSKKIHRLTFPFIVLSSINTYSSCLSGNESLLDFIGFSSCEIRFDFGRSFWSIGMPRFFFHFSSKLKIVSTFKKDREINYS